MQSTINTKMSLVSSGLPAIPARERFYIAYSGILLAVVLVGFSRTYYLRTIFTVPPMPSGALLHGAVLTGWFIGAMLQPFWVATRRINVHRIAGWLLTVLSVGLVWTSAKLILAGAADMGRRAPLMLARGIPPDQIREVAATAFWSAGAAAITFTVLFIWALIQRRSPQTHKRLMLIASVSIIQPALVRIFRDWTAFGEFINGNSLMFAVSVALVLIIPLFIHDWRTRRSIHRATWMGSLIYCSIKLFGILYLAKTTVGQAVIDM